MRKIIYLIILPVIFWMSANAQVTIITENFDATTGSDMPALWAGSNTLSTNYGSGSFYSDHTSGNGRFAFLSNGYFCTELVAAGTYNISFWMRISSSPFENIQLGYCTSQSSIDSTFTSLQTISNDSTTWANYTLTITLPVNSYVTWSSAGGAKTHVVDDVSISIATGINTNNTENLSYKIFPNPSTGNFTFIQNHPNKTEIKIHNIIGELVYKTSATNQETTIDLSSQPKGIYFLETTDNNNIVLNKKIIKQ